MIKILFLCTGNSCRSQMAEGLTRHLKRDMFQPFSAGIETKSLDPRAVKVMAEIGIDISGQISKHVRSLQNQVFDYVVTVCDHARDNCPVFLGAGKIIHVGFDDPTALTRDLRSENEILDIYRRVRDDIRVFVLELPESLTKAQKKD